MTRKDEKQFVEFVKSTGDVVVLPNDSPEERFDPVGSFPKYSTRGWHIFSFFNRDISDNLRVRYVKEQGYWTLERTDSSVIEFCRSSIEHKFSKNRPIVRGRIWAQFTILDEEEMELVPKEPEFTKWYEKIARWLRKNYKRIHPIIYASPGAQKLEEEGKVILDDPCSKCGRGRRYDEKKKGWTCEYCKTFRSAIPNPDREIEILVLNPETGELMPMKIKPGE
jgi:hypothetical protein